MSYDTKGGTMVDIDYLLWLIRIAVVFAGISVISAGVSIWLSFTK